MDDIKIIEGILKKDTAALKLLISKYSNIMLNVVSAILNQSHEKDYIDECIDDILLCLWNNIDTFSVEKGNFKCWLISVSKYKALNYKKKLKRLLDQVDIEEIQLCTDNNLEEEYVLNDKKSKVMELLNNLGGLDKDIFIRKYINDEDTENIAKDLKITPVSVYNRLSRGRKKLKQIILNRDIDI